MAATGHQRRECDREHDERAGEREQRRAREREEERGRAERDEDDGERPSGAVLPGDPREEQRDDERERRRERAEEARHEPPEETVLGVERPVVGQPARAVVVEAELVAEVADRPGAAPPLDVHGVEIDEPADGERGPCAEQCPADPAQLVAAQRSATGR